MHAFASVGSLGQGKNLAYHCIAPDAINMIVAIKNTIALCSENHTSCGTTEIMDDNAAPAPSATNKVVEN